MTSFKNIFFEHVGKDVGHSAFRQNLVKSANDRLIEMAITDGPNEDRMVYAYFEQDVDGMQTGFGYSLLSSNQENVLAGTVKFMQFRYIKRLLQTNRAVLV